ncbi:Hypothetical predicted protein [Mytilus galloprovincialis]|uniref:Reverse transcriptase domain-containing protein n=1 Tax=Mytilus galloprovincialis TaxID=29158 RepID=A0A8B6EV12_MYTGA|nr:Hypothetical predicted protein [Mytilus galloprovincialis]
MDHFDQNNLLCDEQYGFRTKRLCESHLVITINEIAKNMEDVDQTDIILLDFSKAFDEVPHARLLRKMNYYRQQHQALDCLLMTVYSSAALGNQKMQTCCKKTQPRWKNGKRCGKCVSTMRNVQSSVSQDDVSNTNVLHTPWTHIIETIDSGKYLGLTINKDFTWTTNHRKSLRHARPIVKKQDSKKIRDTWLPYGEELGRCTPAKKATAYSTLVRPILEYASPVWDPHQITTIRDIEQVQRRAAPFVYSYYQDNSPGCVTNYWTNFDGNRCSTDDGNRAWCCVTRLNTSSLPLIQPNTTQKGTVGPGATTNLDKLE